MHGTYYLSIQSREQREGSGFGGKAVLQKQSYGSTFIPFLSRFRILAESGYPVLLSWIKTDFYHRKNIMLWFSEKTQLFNNTNLSNYFFFRRHLGFPICRSKFVFRHANTDPAGSKIRPRIRKTRHKFCSEV
jgi:hypothetical protein